jgi:hypothetical protein
MEAKKLDVNRFTEEAYGKVDSSEYQLSITPRKDRSELEAEI